MHVTQLTECVCDCLGALCRAAHLPAEPHAGVYKAWAVINGRMHAVPLRIPRAFYVDAAAAPGSSGGACFLWHLWPCTCKPPLADFPAPFACPLARLGPASVSLRINAPRPLLHSRGSVMLSQLPRVWARRCDALCLAAGSPCTFTRRGGQRKGMYLH